ncbi:Cation-dependent mannose-6-phosphate receptor [Stylophora pistillata]|uniref:Cation-dependent mannose-6-phosphate receptor n=1 Tax=Stylophora pistillata TaxID=50429 RepID=A0A2B4RZ09_STYPI|nr:Cation-dependent mannose-6-phosphate receptor [Stylophora pistillata]
MADCKLLQYVCFCLVVFVQNVGAVTSSCKKLDDCSCRTNDGKTLDLKPVDKDPGPRFTGIKDNSGTTGYTFSWNPCTPFSQGTKCEDTLLRQKQFGRRDLTENVGAVISSCKKITDCSCRTNDGKTLDLKPLDKNPGPSFPQIPDKEKSNYFFLWNPCTGFNEGSTCKGTLLCQKAGDYLPVAKAVSSFDVNSDGTINITYVQVTSTAGGKTYTSALQCFELCQKAGDYLPVAKAVSSFDVNSDGTINITYVQVTSTAGGKTYTRQAIIKLKCDESQRGKFELFHEQEVPGEQKSNYVCQQTGSVYVPIADEVSSFDVNGDGTISIIYHSVTGSEGKIRRAIIKLKCDPSQPDRGTLDPFTEKSNPAAENKINYTSTFTSKYACPESEGLSAGSILLIVFFPLVLVYFIAGLLFNKIHKGVNSFPEMIPNHSFWGDLPFLVKDGCVFTFQGIAGCCKRVSMKFKGDSYAEI